MDDPDCDAQQLLGRSDPVAVERPAPAQVIRQVARRHTPETTQPLTQAPVVDVHVLDVDGAGGASPNPDAGGLAVPVVAFACASWTAVIRLSDLANQGHDLVEPGRRKRGGQRLQALGLIQRRQPGKPLLEMGCAHGRFLSMDTAVRPRNSSAVPAHPYLTMTAPNKKPGLLAQPGFLHATRLIARRRYGHPAAPG